MLYRSLFLLFVTLSILSFSACQRAEQKATATAEAKRYELNGKVISVDQSGGKAKIEHDEIKGYMPAMTMNFPIKQDWVLRELKPGHKVSADLVIEPNNDYWLENVTISAAPADLSGVSEPIHEATTDKIGKELVDFKLINQDGKRLTSKDFRGKTLVLTFIFTRCPDREYCPMMSLNMSDLEKIIRQSPELKDKVRLLSISFDPEFDKPEVLRKYGTGYLGNSENPNFDIWQLATGSQQDVQEVAQFFGLNTIKEGERLVHNLRTAIISPDGKVVKIYSGNDWKPADIMKDLQSTSKAEQS